MFLSILSWAKAGDLITLDNTRELLVPYLITQEKLLYRDIYYFYGPIAPYSLALLVKFFGATLTPLYLFSLGLILTYALLLYSLARNILNQYFSTIVALLFLSQLAFYNTGSLSYVLPYAYAALLGSFCFTLLTFFLLFHVKTSKSLYLLCSALLCSFVVFIKQDYAISCALLLTFYLLLTSIRPGKNQNYFDYRFFIRQSVMYLGLMAITTIILYGLFSVIFGWQDFFEGIFSFYLLDTRAADILRATSRSELTFSNAIYAFNHAIGLFIVILFLFMLLGLKKIRVEPKPILYYSTFFALLLGIFLFIVLFEPHAIQNLVVWFIFTLNKIYTGLNYWVFALLIWAFISMKNNHHRTIAVIAAGALFISYRMLFNLGFFLYSFYVLPLGLVAFVYIISHSAPLLLSKSFKIEFNAWKNISKLLLLLILGTYLLLNILFYSYKAEQYTTPFGTYSVSDHFTNNKNTLLLEVSRYIKEHTSENETILAYPIANTVYLYTKRLPASKYYYLHPGILLTLNQEKRVIEEIDENKPAYIVISNENFRLYHGQKSDTFGEEQFYPLIYTYIKDNYDIEKVFSRDLGPYVQTPEDIVTKSFTDGFTWKFTVYKRK